MTKTITKKAAIDMLKKAKAEIIVKNTAVYGVMKHPFIDNREADRDWVEMPEKHTAYFAKWSLSKGFELRTIAYNKQHKMFEPVKLYESYQQPPMTVELINEQVIKITDALRKEFIKRENKKIVKELEVLG
jgi:hypothetical protein